MFMDTLFYFLPVIIALGVITSYEDLKFGKIKNRWITLTVLSSIIINSAIIYSVGNIYKNYYYDLLVNIIISFVIAVLLFYFEVWSAGDGKLFFAYAILLPLTAYSKSYLPYFPSFALLVNIFVPYLFYVLIKILIKPDKKLFLESLKELFGKEFFLSILKFFSITWVISVFLSIISINNIIITYGISLIVYSFGFGFLEKKYKRTVVSASIFLSLLRLIFDKSVYTISFWGYFLLIVLIYQMIFRSLVQNLLAKSTIEYLSPKNLKKGMTLAFTLIKTNKEISISKKPEEKDSKKIFMSQNKVLEEKDIKTIKSKIRFKIPVYTKIAFAHIMLIGVILTILIKGNILIYLINLFR